jgi:asparagine synthase (glutamine-hydrolysing)
MSTVIGYWSGNDGGGTSDKLHRLLVEAVAGAGRDESKIISPRAGQSSPRPDRAAPPQSINFGIAVCGTHATLEAADDSATGGATRASLEATLAASGAGATADVWFKAGGGGLTLGRGVFGRATIFWTRTDGAVWFSSRLGLLLSVVGSARVSVAGFYAYGCYSYVPAPLTPVENIYAVPAGAEVVWSAAAPEAPPQTRTLYEKPTPRP